MFLSRLSYLGVNEQTPSPGITPLDIRDASGRGSLQEAFRLPTFFRLSEIRSCILKVFAVWYRLMLSVRGKIGVLLIPTSSFYWFTILAYIYQNGHKNP